MNSRHIQSDLNSKQQELHLVKQKLDEVNKQIRSKINASNDTQLKMLPHLRTVIAMLRLGREIMETKLDKKLTGTVSIPDFKATQKLPADIENNLSLFTSTLADNIHADRADNIHADRGMAEALLNGVDDYRGVDEKDRKYSEEDLAQVTEASELTLQQGMSLLDSACCS